MDYQGIDIRIEKRRYIERIPADGPYSKTKDVVASENSVQIHLCGLNVPDPAFAFELQAIFEEFLAKKLNFYQEHVILNSITGTECNDISFHITRKSRLLLVTLKDDEGTDHSVIELDSIGVKAVSSMLNKAIHAMELH